jgi:hypothetical protein
MKYELIYDVATTSQAPRAAFVLGLSALAVAALWSGWLKVRGLPLHSGAALAGVVAAIFLLLGLGLAYEQRRLATRTDVRTIGGAVTGHWTKRVRRAGSNSSYWEWEGFCVGGVAFAYARNLEQNYFHNGGGAHALDLREGMVLRLRYIEENEQGKTRNHILRLERRVDGAGE